jgi:hypothetical protein
VDRSIFWLSLTYWISASWISVSFRIIFTYFLLRYWDGLFSFCFPDLASVALLCPSLIGQFLLASLGGTATVTGTTVPVMFFAHHAIGALVNCRVAMVVIDHEVAYAISYFELWLTLFGQFG